MDMPNSLPLSRHRFKFKAKEMAPKITELGRKIGKDIPNKKLLLVGIDFAGIPITAGLERAIKNRDIAAVSLRASSKKGEFDEQKFSEILTKARKENRAVVFVDWRTKTGALGGVLRQKMPKNTPWKYAVLYDPLKRANIRVSVKEGPWFGDMKFDAITKRRIQKEVESYR